MSKALGAFGICLVGLLLLFAAFGLVSSFNSVGEDFATRLQSHSVEIDGAQAMGSGVVIKNGLVLTAAHVTRATQDSMGDVVVKINGENRTGHVMWQSNDNGWGNNDIALVQVDTSGKVPAELSCRDMKAGDVVYSFGNPLGVANILTKGIVASSDDGIVSVFGVDDAYLRMMVPTGIKLLNLTVLPGNSGGGIYDSDGYLVGLSELMISHNFVGMTGAPELCKALAI